MFECVRQTIAVIQAKISSLQALCSTLEKDFEQQPAGNGNGVAAMPSAPTRTKPVARSTNGRPAGAGNNAERIIQVAAGLFEPMGVTALAVAAGIPKSSAKSSFDRWLKRGWLVKIAIGQYKRTKSFGKKDIATIATATPRVHGPLAERILTESARVDAEKKLQQALKQRDAARAAGRDSIVDVFQREIDKLEAQLAS